MNWLNLETRTRTRPEFIGAEPEQRATWLCLMLYCAEHETGGVIRDCSTWGDRRWMQTIGCTKAEAHASCELWAWTGSNLRVWGYPVEKESEVAAMRAGGKRGGKRSGEARRKHGFEGGLEGGLERKGKERKGIGKEEGAARADAVHDFTTLSGQVKALHDVCPGVADQAWLSEIEAARGHPVELVSAVSEFCRDEANSMEPSTWPTSRLRAYIRRAIRGEGDKSGPMTALQRRDAEQRRIAAGARG